MSGANATNRLRRGSLSGGRPGGEMELASIERASARELEEARQGFEILLRSKRMSPRWIAENADEVFAQAQREYAEWLARGREAKNPPGWLVNCAWRRTQDRLDYESRHPKAVSFEQMLHAADQRSATPEEIALEGDRREELLRALAVLDPRDRELLKLAYFDGLSVREAGKQLGLERSSAARHHNQAIERLRAMLEGRVDVPLIDVGAAAASGAAIDALAPGAFGAAISWVADVTHGGLQRAEELSRRIMPGGDPAGVGSLAGAARAAGVCGAAALACLASGVIGPGVGGIGLADRKALPPAPARQAPATPLVSQPTIELSRADEERPGRAADQSTAAEGHRTGARAQGRRRTEERREAPAPQASGEVVRSEFGLESEVSAPPLSESAPPEGSSRANPAPPASNRDVEAEFGL